MVADVDRLFKLFTMESFFWTSLFRFMRVANEINCSFTVGKALLPFMWSRSKVLKKRKEKQSKVIMKVVCTFVMEYTAADAES